METPPPSTPPAPPSAAATWEIAFFDVETTIPFRAGAGYSLLEFGAILVCSRRLVEVGSYSTLIRPSDPSAISAASVRCNGITHHSVSSAPSFCDVADNVFTVLNGRVWAGHNIVRFDVPRIREAFAEIGRPAPEAKGFIDTLLLLTRTFGRRAGDMKMATLASYFGLGRQMHRSLEDVRMNLEVLKYCSTVLFLESSLPDLYAVDTITPGQVNVDDTHGGVNMNFMSPSNLTSNEGKFLCADSKTIMEVNHPAEASSLLPERDPSDLISHLGQIRIDASGTDTNMDATSTARSPEFFATVTASEGSNGYAGFLEPSEVLIQCISAPQVRFYQFDRRILHKDVPLQLCCTRLKVQFGIDRKFIDRAGRPKLSIVVDAPASLCQILEACDQCALQSSLRSGSRSEWRCLVKKNDYKESPYVRLNIPTAANNGSSIYMTEIHQRELSGNTQKLVFSGLDPCELDSFFVQGTVIDSFFSVESYDYQNSAGLRLLAKKLVVYSK